MEDRSGLRRVWEQVHQAAPGSIQPLNEVVEFMQAIQRNLAPGARVLDAGCGRGRNTLYLAQLGFDVWASDWSVTAVSQARRRLAQAGCQAAVQAVDLTRIPYRAGCFDAVICVHVLPCAHRADLFASLAELRRVLRPGGWLCLDLLHIEDSEYGCGPELEPHTFLDSDGTPLHFSTPEEVDDLLTGWQVRRLDRVELGPRPRVAWAVWAQRPG